MWSSIGNILIAVTRLINAETNNMQLTGKTLVLGILGDPVQHSLSPRMQNAAIQAGNLDAVYVPFRVTREQLCDAVRGIRAMGIRGVNLTIPHKEAACDLVDELDEHAQLTGAINTIVNNNGRLKGYNTDGQGLLKALKQELGIEVSGRRIMLLGAGGACRAALVALSQSGAAWIGIANRTRERAEALIAELSENFKGTTLASFSLSASLAGCCPEPVDLLVNTSAVGLKGEAFDFPATGCVSPGGSVYDMVYAAEPTPLVREALQAGFATADGLGMLAGQGEIAFQLWFDMAPQKHIMRRALDLKS
jgi:shikimate dehydrogenase